MVQLSIENQCELLGVCRSGHYYKPYPESSLNLEFIRLIDKHYLKNPEKEQEECLYG